MTISNKETYLAGVLRNAAAELHSAADEIQSGYLNSPKHIAHVRDEVTEAISNLHAQFYEILDDFMADSKPECDCLPCKSKHSSEKYNCRWVTQDVNLRLVKSKQPEK